MSPGVDTRLAARLEERSDEITRRWHEMLHQRVKLRPDNIFPGAKLLDGMPSVVEWITRSLRHTSDPTEAHQDALRELAEHWRLAGFSVEESLLHFRLLAQLLFATLEGLVREGEEAVRPLECLHATRRICRAVDTLQTTVVATYRDAEEDRIASFGETLAHEVRDQLGAALAAIQLVRTLRDDAGHRLDPEREDELLAGAESALEKAGGLVSAVRTVSRADQPSEGGWKWRPLTDLVGEIVAEARAAGGLDVRLDPVGEIPGALVPEGPVTLILHNLIENGVKYRDPEKEERWVRVQARREPDGHVVVQVGDNGLGISESEQARVFNRFYRGGEARGEGFGLGLSIARRAARSIGGRLMMESEAGRGSTFGFTIPVESQGPDISS